MTSIWEQIQARWPARFHQQQLAYKAVRWELKSLLAGFCIQPTTFSHFGLVVGQIDTAAEAIGEILGQPWQPAKRDWVEAFHVHVARGDLDNMELELIQPAGESFFADFLTEHGEGLHHVSFTIENIQACHERLVNGGIRPLSGGVRQGSHGQITFLQPEPYAPLCLELCQPKK